MSFSLIPRGTLIDRYQIEDVLGEGGMARVYRARHTQLGSTHAIKQLKSSGDVIKERLMLSTKTNIFPFLFSSSTRTSNFHFFQLFMKKISPGGAPGPFF